MTLEVLKLAGQGAIWYANWLLHGLRTVDLGQDPGDTPAFAGAEAVIHRDENGIVGDLAAIRERLDVSSRIDFDGGMTEAVRMLDLARREDVVLAKQLTRLASLVGNREAVQVLALCLDPARSDEDARDLNVEIVGAIVAHPYPDDTRSETALYRLVRSASFKDNRAPKVLRALCVAAPAKLVTHLALLNRFLASLYAPEILQGNNTRRSTARQLVADIYRLVDASTFKMAMEKWDTRCPPELGCGQLAYEQDWFVQVILRSDELLRLAQEAAQLTAETMLKEKMVITQQDVLDWRVILMLYRYISAQPDRRKVIYNNSKGGLRSFNLGGANGLWSALLSVAASDKATRERDETILFGGVAREHGDR